MTAAAEAGEGVAAGDVMNTGARLQAAAPPGGILVGEATYRATRDVVEYGEPAQIPMKGKAEAVLAWPALALRSAPERQLVGARLVGRTEELDLLRRTLGRVQRESSPQLLTIVGNPGMGKSRLIRELFAGLNGAVDAPLRLEGHTLPYGEGASFHALANMHYVPSIDYHRKRGVIEEINRDVESVEQDIANRRTLHDTELDHEARARAKDDLLQREHVLRQL